MENLNDVVDARRKQMAQHVLGVALPPALHEGWQCVYKSLPTRFKLFPSGLKYLKMFCCQLFDALGSQLDFLNFVGQA